MFWLLLHIIIAVNVQCKSLRKNTLVGQGKQFQQLDKKDSNTLFVHLIPHSHDDVGWLKTYEQYYYGLNNRIQWAGIQYTIDSVVRSLFFDSSKKFIQVEIAYFKLWWDEQNDEVRNKTKYLVKRGQLEFINGGWCMNDEATAYYEDIIDQMTLGHKFLIDNFQIRPTIGWQIDPFGHTAAQAVLSHLMGFNAWFFSRIDYQDFDLRKKSKAMEMVMTNQGYPVFTHVNYNHYEAPPGFSFDTINQQSEAIVDNPKSPNFNVDKRAKVLVDYFKTQSESYQGNILMHTLGSDFAWSNAPMYYQNIDRLIRYINSHREFNMQVFYSTPSEYIKQINQEDLEYPTKSDDFMPYADKPNAYWTGYFTSRVGFKLLIKQYGRAAQILRKFVATLAINGKSQYYQINRGKVVEALQTLDEALATNQHHDAVTGTAKQFVTDDYINMLCNGMLLVNQQVYQLLEELVQFETQEQELPKFTVCNFNSSASNCSEVFEALNSNRTVQLNLIDTKENVYLHHMRIKVPNLNLIIYDQNNQVTKGDVFCLDSVDKTDCDLYFVYERNPKLTLQYFRITPEFENPSARIVQGKYDTTNQPNPLNFTTDSQISLNGSTAFQLAYQYYQCAQDKSQNSGAYIFRPSDPNETPVELGTVQATQLYEGQTVHILIIEREKLFTIIKKLSYQENHYEIETYISEVPVLDGVGKEVILKVKTGIKNEDTFFTDSSGLYLQKRKLNFRETWNLEVHQPVAGNYYPVNGVILIEDPQSGDAAAIMNDRSQGGTSLRPGEIELMIHRRTLRDDARGVGEQLNEKVGQRGLDQLFIHTLSFYNKRESPSQHRLYQYLQDTKPLVYFSFPSRSVFQTKVQSFRITYPRDLEKLFSPQPLTKYYLQLWGTDSYLYRIHNMNEQLNVTIPQLEQHNLTETTLTGNQLWSEWQESRLKWKLQGEKEEPRVEFDGNVTPQQIRTFILIKAVAEIAK